MKFCDPLRVFWVSPHRIQIGLDDSTALYCDDLSPKEQRLIAHLSQELTPQEFFSYAAKNGVKRTRAEKILNMLARSGMLTEYPEMDAYHPVLHHENFDLKATKLYIPRLDPLAVEAALHLASRIPTMITDDRAKISSQDHPMLAQHVGKERIVAFRTAVKNRPAGTKVFQGQEKTSHYALVTALQEPDPIRCADLLRSIPAYTLAYVEDTNIRVGPTVLRDIPGACAGCIFYHHVDRDPHWVDIALQAYSFRHYHPTRPSLIPAAGLIAAEVLSVMGGNKPGLIGKQWVVPPFPDHPYLVDIPQHPGCACSFHPSHRTL